MSTLVKTLFFNKTLNPLLSKLMIIFLQYHVDCFIFDAITEKRSPVTLQLNIKVSLKVISK